MKLEFLLAWYNVKNVEEAKKFYGGVLGLNPEFEVPGWAEFSHAKNATAIALAGPRADKSASAAGATVVLRVDDMDKARAELSAKGVTFLGGVEEIPGIVRISTFTDPFGNHLQLAQPLMQR